MDPDSEAVIDRYLGRPAYERHRALSERIRRARIARLGEDAVADLSRRLGVPERTWRNYEDGVSMPADVVLRFLVLTGVTACELLQDSSPVGDGHPDFSESVWDATNSATKHAGTAPCKEPLPSP